jgi:hypothetical protein
LKAPFRLAARKVSHAPRVKDSIGPPGFFESRT